VTSVHFLNSAYFTIAVLRGLSYLRCVQGSCWLNSDSGTRPRSSLEDNFRSLYDRYSFSKESCLIYIDITVYAKAKERRKRRKERKKERKCFSVFLLPLSLSLLLPYHISLFPSSCLIMATGRPLLMFSLLFLCLCASVVNSAETKKVNSKRGVSVSSHNVNTTCGDLSPFQNVSWW
jgi:hypothetical protein